MSRTQIRCGGSALIAASLLWLTTRRALMGEMRTRSLGLVALIAALALFLVIGVRQAIDVF